MSVMLTAMEEAMIEPRRNLDTGALLKPELNMLTFVEMFSE